MLTIATATLRSRKGGTIGALAAVVLAVVLVVSCGILLDSSLRATIDVQRLGAAAVVVQADQRPHGGENDLMLPERARVPAGLAGTLGRVPGVAVAIADRSFDVRIGGDAGRLLAERDPATAVGHGWQSAALTPYRLLRGRPPVAAGDVVVDDDLARRGRLGLGRVLDVATAGGARRVSVVGIAAPRVASDEGRAGSLFFRDDVAAGLSATGGNADLIGLVVRAGTDPDRVAAAIARVAPPGTEVLTGTRRGDAESPEAALGREDTVAGLIVFAVFAGFIAAFVVAGTFALSVQQRYRELALLRAIGATPRQVRRMIAGEALLVALTATALATPVGVVAAHVEQRAFVGAGILPAGVDLVVSWLPLAAGLLAAVVTTQLASFASARRASRIRPTEALRDARADRRLISWPRGLAGLAAVAGGFAVLLQPGGGRDGVAPAAALVWMLAVALLGPVLAWPFTTVIGASLGLLSRGPGQLAHANTRAALRRVASVAAPIMLAIALAGTIVYAKMIVRHEAIHQAADRTTAATVVRARGGDGVTPAMIARIRRVTGVVTASGSFPTAVLVSVDGTNLRRFDARAIDPPTLAAVADPGVTDGSLAAIGNDALAISTDLAARLDRGVGDRMGLRLGDGVRIAPRVAATYRRSLGFGDVLLPHALAIAHVGHPLDDLVLVTSRPGDEAAVRQRLRQLDPGIEVLERARYVAGVRAVAAKDALAVYVLLGLIVAFCALALVNAIAMSTGERSRELALLRVVGAERRQLRSMIRAETAIMVVFGVTIGTLVAVPGLVLFSRDVSGALLPDVSLRVYAGLVGLYTVLAFVATAVPVRLAARVDPVHALGARE